MDSNPKSPFSHIYDELFRKLNGQGLYQASPKTLTHLKPSSDQNKDSSIDDILAVSSDMIKAIVVKDFTTLLNLADFVRAKKLPKLKIIPLDAILKFNISLPKDSSIIGPLSDYVKCDSKFSALKTFLFGNVLLVNSRQTALQLSKNGYKTVTLDGEFFEAKASAVIVDINSKISKLTKIISMSTSVEGLNRSITLLKKYIQSKKHSLKKVENNLQNYKDRLSVSETGLGTTNNNYSDLKTKVLSASKMSYQLASRISQFIKSCSKIIYNIISNKRFLTGFHDSTISCQSMQIHSCNSCIAGAVSLTKQ